MSQHHASRREFVTGLGLGIAGLSIGGEARADGLFGRRLGARSRNTSYDSSYHTWQKFEPEPVGITKPYGFVVDHHAYWGLPIPGYDYHPQPWNQGPTDPNQVPSQLTVTNIQIHTRSDWSGGEFTLFATLTPPLFHSFHHKTDEDIMPVADAFERRAERNIIETDKFGAREPLKGDGQRACVKLFDVKYNGQCCE